MLWQNFLLRHVLFYRFSVANLYKPRRSRARWKREKLSLPSGKWERKSGSFCFSIFQSRLSQEFIHSTRNFLHKSSASSDQKQSRRGLVVVEGETDALKNPAIDMFLGAQVRLEHQSDTHRIPALWSRVHWRAECILRIYKESNEKGWKQDWR